MILGLCIKGLAPVIFRYSIIFFLRGGGGLGSSGFVAPYTECVSKSNNPMYLLETSIGYNNITLA